MAPWTASAISPLDQGNDAYIRLLLHLPAAAHDASALFGREKEKQAID
jgi:hypothetical protein